MGIQKTVSNTPRKTKFSRKIKALIWVASLALAYTVTGFFIAPAIVKAQLLKRLPALTLRRAAVREVTFNPFTFGLAVRGLTLTESNGEAFAGLDDFHIQFQALSSLARRSWVFQDVTLSHPFAHLIRRKDGSFNFDNLIPTNTAPPPKPAAPTVWPPLVVEKLSIDGASLEADDFSPASAFHDKLAPIHLQLTDFTILLHAASTFGFSISTDAGERIDTTGQITVQPLQLAGHLHGLGLDLSRYGPYWAAFTKAHLAGGKVDLTADYQMAIDTKGFDATMTNATLQLNGLKVAAPDSAETVVSIPTLTVELTEASVVKKTAHIRSVKSQGGSCLVRQDHDGKINLLDLMKTNATPASASPSPPWQVRVDDITLDDYAASIEDERPARPVKTAISGLHFAIMGFDTANNRPLSVETSMRLNGQGSLAIQGKVASTPFAGELNFDLTGLDLTPFTPYLPESLKLNISKGHLNIKGHGGFTNSEDSFAGDIVLNDFAAADAAHDRNLFKFDSLAINGIQASYPPAKLEVDQIALTGFNANLIVDTNGQLNILAVVSNGPPAAPAASAPKPREEAAITLGALVMNKASFHFADESITPHAVFDLQELSGSIKDLSTQPQKPASVDFHGTVDQFSPYTITGSFNPLARELSFDLAMTCKNLDLTSMTPYMERYGGYPVNKGKLLLDSKYNVAQGKLTASNKIDIADLILGARNSSAYATHLPVKLGVALLKDRQGNINLEIPLSGNLDDPDFRFLPLLGKVLENLLGKAAESPFTFLGRALGGGEREELSSVDFAPGESVLAAGEKAKLKKLARALYERPALTLQIAGACAPSIDSAVLARRHLQRRVNKMRADEESAAGQPVESVEAIQLAPADYARLLQKLYEQTFGPINTNQPTAVPSNSPPAAVPPPVKAAPMANPDSWRSSIFIRGAERMVLRDEAARPASQPAPPTPIAPVEPPPLSAPVAASASAPDLAQMEQKLLARITVPNDELRDLMQARARAVQTALLEPGQLSADRIFIVAPKPVDTASQGQTRANFSLE